MLGLKPRQFCKLISTFSRGGQPNNFCIWKNIFTMLQKSAEAGLPKLRRLKEVQVHVQTTRYGHLRISIIVTLVIQHMRQTQKSLNEIVTMKHCKKVWLCISGQIKAITGSIRTRHWYISPYTDVGLILSKYS